MAEVAAGARAGAAAVLTAAAGVSRRLDALAGQPEAAHAAADARRQVDRLLSPGFVAATGLRRLPPVPKSSTASRTPSSFSLRHPPRGHLVGQLALEGSALRDVAERPHRPTTAPLTRCGLEDRSNTRPSLKSMTSSVSASGRP